MNRKLSHALASLVLMYSAKAWSQETVVATIEGPGEYTMSGSTECGGKATSTIQPGERFIARELSDGEKDWEVYLKSGISGTIPRNRVRVLPDEPLARLNFASCKNKWQKLQSKRIKMTDDVAWSTREAGRRKPGIRVTATGPDDRDARTEEQKSSAQVHVERRKV